jgi:hypothetical protein
VIVDDHHDPREGLLHLLGLEDDIKIVSKAENGARTLPDRATLITYAPITGTTRPRTSPNGTSRVFLVAGGSARSRAPAGPSLRARQAGRTALGGVASLPGITDYQPRGTAPRVASAAKPTRSVRDPCANE